MYIFGFRYFSVTQTKAGTQKNLNVQPMVVLFTNLITSIGQWQYQKENGG